MPRASERAIVLLVAAIQFINILDFVMVMPMGPDFARALGIPTSQLGVIGGSYTASAAVSGLLGSFVLDRFDRRKALAVAMLGLVAGTAAGGFAQGLPSLVFARVLAGFFGGPATSLSFSIVADTVPPERRGKAMGTVMAAFSVASIVGVPLGLEVARRFGWYWPFWGLSIVGLVVAALALWLLPPMTAHLARGGAGLKNPLPLLRDGLVLRSYAMTAVVMAAGFILIPNLSAYLQLNLGFPRADLGWLYGIGGVASLITLQVGGRLVDRFGSARSGTASALMFIAVVYAGFVAYRPFIPILPLFVGFFIALGLRNVSYNTLASRVPRAEDRAQFLSLQSSIQHLASAAGSIVSSRILVETGGRLGHVEWIAAVAIALTLLLPLLLFSVEARVRAAEAAR